MRRSPLIIWRQPWPSDDDFALPLVCKGLFCLLLGRKELNDVAQQAERDARELVAKDVR